MEAGSGNGIFQNRDIAGVLAILEGAEFTFCIRSERKATANQLMIPGERQVDFEIRAVRARPHRAGIGFHKTAEMEIRVHRHGEFRLVLAVFNGSKIGCCQNCGGIFARFRAQSVEVEVLDHCTFCNFLEQRPGYLVAGQCIVASIQDAFPKVNLVKFICIDDICGNIDLAGIRVHPIGIITGIDSIGESIPGFRAGDNQCSCGDKSPLAPIGDHTCVYAGILSQLNDHLTVVAVCDGNIETIRIFAGRHTKIKFCSFRATCCKTGIWNRYFDSVFAVNG